MRGFTPGLRFRELFILSSAGTLIGHILPAASGMVTRAVYLRQRHGLSLLQFAGTQVTLLIGVMVAAGLVASVGISVVWVEEGHRPPLVWFPLCVGSVGGGLLLLFGRQWLTKPSGRLSRLAPLTEVWSMIGNNRSQLLSAAGLLAVRAMVSFATMGWLYVILQPQLNAFWYGGITESLTTALLIVRITPGNLGLYEWAVAGLGREVGIAVSTGILAAFTFRVFGLLVITAVSGVLLLDRSTREIYRARRMV